MFKKLKIRKKEHVPICFLLDILVVENRDAVIRKKNDVIIGKKKDVVIGKK